ncbi:hypothetical protein J2736_001831 [Paenibacillus qinlingensis]|uniref:Spore germination protein n=1 Tax=Paenibacillus qinlingensis TaxID=1837343 RepID=A0ABU1NT33_9BACL|nr:hypothetical protein [Paenibacillus qinlingensis]
MHGMVYVGSGFIEFMMIIAVQHRLKSGVKVWKIGILAVLMVYISLGPIIGAVTEFGPVEAAKQSEPPYEQWRLVKLGSNIEHVDFLSVFQWMSGAIIRVGFSQFLLAEMVPFIHAKKRSWFILCVTVSYLLLSMIPLEKYTVYLWMYRFYFPISLVVALFVSIVCIVILLFSKRFKEGTA